MNGRRLIGTTPQMFGVGDDGKPVPEADQFQYRKGRAYQFADGRAFVEPPGLIQRELHEHRERDRPMVGDRRADPVPNGALVGHVGRG